MTLKYVSRRDAGKKSSNRKLSGKEKKLIKKRKKYIFLSRDPLHEREDIIPLHHEILQQEELENILFKAFTLEHFGEKCAWKLAEQFSGHNLSKTLFTSRAARLAFVTDGKLQPSKLYL